jgi:hypothetical protein
MICRTFINNLLQIHGIQYYLVTFTPKHFATHIFTISPLNITLTYIFYINKTNLICSQIEKGYRNTYKKAKNSQTQKEMLSKYMRCTYPRA